MQRASYKDIRFVDKELYVEAQFLDIFSFEIAKEDLRGLAGFNVIDGEIVFEKEVPDNRFDLIITEGFQKLCNKATGKPSVYVHKNSGIPLIGANSFGIIDRGTNLIEVKPITGCNLRCIYCSVDDANRQTDFVVEKDYLILEFNRLSRIKKHPIEAHIGTQGEPLYYRDLVPLIKDLKKNPKVSAISMDTNATMLSKMKVDELCDAGLTRFNISLDSMREDNAAMLSGCRYDLKPVVEIIKYASKKTDVLIAPILVPTKNEHDMQEIVLFAKSLGVRTGIQNFLEYREGRNPVKAWNWERFNGFIRELEEKTGEKLFLSQEDFSIKKDESYPIPFRNKETAKVEIICRGRLPGESIGRARERAVTISRCSARGIIKARITRVKHNIIYAVPA